MLTNPQTNNVDTHRAIGKAQLSLIVLSALFSLICDFMLLSYRSGEQSALSGQLLQGGEATGGSFLSYVFDYFGNVTYLMPWLSVYVVCLLCFSGLSLKNVDFFRVGLRLLGVNILVIGLCMLFSGLMVSDSMGAGGILGDYLNLASFSNLPRYLAPLIPVALVFIGMMLVAVRSPLWFCDTLGSAIMRFIPIKDQDEASAKVQKSKEQASATTSQGVSFNVGHGFSADSTQASSQGLGMAEDQVTAPRFFRGVSDLKTKLRFGTENQENERLNENQGAGMQARVEPSFGGATASSKITPNYYQGASAQTPVSSVSSSVYHQDSNADIPPVITPAYGRSFGSGATSSFDNTRYGTPNADYSVGARQTSEQPQEQESSVSTIINGVCAQRKQTGTKAEEETEKEPNVRRTIITRSEESGFVGQNERLEPSFDSYSVPKREALKTSDETKSDDEEDDGISTVVTRGQSITKMKAGEDVETIQDPSVAYEASYPSNYAGVSPSASIPSAQGPLPPQEDESYPYEKFSFTDEPLESEFSDEEVDNGSKLRPVAEPISERDLSYSDSYTNAVRGLGAHAEPVQLTQRTTQDDVYAQPQDRAQNVDISTSKASRYGFVRQDDEQSTQESGVDIQAQTATNSSNETLSPKVCTPSQSTMIDAEENQENDLGNDASIEPPTASIHKFPTKDYVSSVATVPTTCDPDDLWRPPFDLLARSEHSEMVDEQTIHNFIERINRTFQDFSVQAQVASYQAGPVITRYDVKLDRGVKSSVIRGLQADLSRTLTTIVRVLDVVPGTPYMGLEIPNPKRKLITLRDVVESEQFLDTKAQLPLCLGVDAAGVPVVADLAKAPHLLIAGTTGSGKSAGINSMLLSLLLTRSPAELRFILVDPKQVEFSLYEDLPHLICPVISETDQTMAALQWCVGEMERRYRLISNLKLRSVNEYNAYIRQQNSLGKVVFDPAWSPEMGGQPMILRPLPAIVMVIDEFADLMAAFEGRGKNKGPQPDQLVQRLAQKARAASMHLMLATQSPRSSVITGTLKANLPSRIAYTVQSNLDSRVILDDNGAENLLGNGDMLAKLMGLANNQLFRAHGPFASNKDVNAVVEAWKEHSGAPEYLDGVTDLEDGDDEGDIEAGGTTERVHKLDKDYDAVVAYVREYQNQNNGAAPSMSLVQTEFCFGYPRTKKIFMQMKRNGDL